MRTIRGNLRGAGGVSFFAFQDVITSVTGVVIVIALLLALQIDKIPDPGKGDAAGVPGGISADAESRMASSEELEALDAELAEAKRSLAALQGQKRAVETPEEVAAEITELEKSIARRLAKKRRAEKKLNSNSDAPELRTKAAKVAVLRRQIEEIRKKLDEIQPGNQKLSAQLRELELKVKRAEANLLKARDKQRDLVLIPEMSDTTKEAIVVDVTDRALVVKRFDRGDEQRLASDLAFARYCGRMKSSEHYFVFFVRPSGASRFEDLRKIARKAGFEVGYDAIGEKVKLKIGKKKPK